MNVSERKIDAIREEINRTNLNLLFQKWILLISQVQFNIMVTFFLLKDSWPYQFQ